MNILLFIFSQVLLAILCPYLLQDNLQLLNIHTGVLLTKYMVVGLLYSLFLPGYGHVIYSYERANVLCVFSLAVLLILGGLVLMKHR